MSCATYNTRPAKIRSKQQYFKRNFEQYRLMKAHYLSDNGFEVILLQQMKQPTVDWSLIQPAIRLLILWATNSVFHMTSARMTYAAYAKKYKNYKGNNYKRHETNLLFLILLLADVLSTQLLAQLCEMITAQPTSLGNIAQQRCSMYRTTVLKRPRGQYRWDQCECYTI